MLNEILDCVNEQYKGTFTEADRVIIGTLHEKLLKNQKLRGSASTTDPVIFTESIFPQAFGVAAMENYESLFQDKSKYTAIMSALAGIIYRELRKLFDE